MGRSAPSKVCGRLFVAKPGEPQVTDVCGLEHGHDFSLGLGGEEEPSPHVGKWTGMKWETFINGLTGKKGRHMLEPPQTPAAPSRIGGGLHVKPPESPASRPTP